MAVTAALSPSSFPQSSTGRLDVIIDHCAGPLIAAHDDLQQLFKSFVDKEFRGQTKSFVDRRNWHFHKSTTSFLHSSGHVAFVNLPRELLTRVYVPRRPKPALKR